jgi:NAD(P)-dependent dehydrogenase (short-subunit alcohol dehydrogenase family)
MAEAGASVMLTARKPDELEAAAAEIGDRAANFVAHAGDVEAAERCVAATMERFGALDILVNNAATNPHYGPVLETPPSKFDKTVEVNLRGPLYWVRAAHRAAFASRPGVVLNIASVGGMRTERSLGIYNMTKAALIHLTRQLAAEMGPTRVVGIAPGLIATDFSQVLIDDHGDRLAQKLPTGRLGRPEDVAALALFLASDHASWITGDTFVVDGGAGVASSAAD